MYHEKRVSKLTAIPEKTETDFEEKQSNLWVPKEKHDVLKAKYKCLKKLFQIYDARVIGILPQVKDSQNTDETPRRRQKRKSHHRTRTDACTSVINANAGDAKVLIDSENNTDDSYKSETPRSFTSIQVEAIAKSLIKLPTVLRDDKCIQNSDENILKRSNSAPETDVKPIIASYPNVCEKPRSRIQNYFQRLFGLKSEKIQETNSQEYNNFTKSDNTINNPNKRRRRKILKVTSPKRSKHVSSEMNLRDVNILSHIQFIQRQCLLDRTQRQCPIVNCKMITNGIINYNDHLNLCHFPERKYICHYCHEGFEEIKDKLIHENNHIGVTKLIPNNKPEDINKKVSVTQTEPGISEEKLLKIMSFIDKIPNVDQRNNTTETIKERKMGVSHFSGNCGKKTTSWPNFSTSARGTKGLSKSASERSPRTTIDSDFSCKMCGEEFENRHYLQFHVDVDHRDIDTSKPKPLHFTSKDGHLSINETLSLSHAPSASTFDCKKDAVSYDPSTNIIYFTSLESVDDCNEISSNGPIDTGYRWESGTKIIRV